MAEKKYGTSRSQLEHLEHLRDTWDDQIPDKVVHSDSGITTKARRSWFQGIVASTDIALATNEINDQDKRLAAEELVEKFTSDDFIQQTLTTTHDIETANKLIDIILGRKN